MTQVSEMPVRLTQWSVDELRELVRSRRGCIFAILDATNEPRVPQKAGELGDRANSLFRGKAAHDYRAVAPYLVSVDEELLDWLLENLWHDPWGMIAISTTDLASLRKHFRRFLLVKDPDGNQMYFRFYDPRVLQAFLPTCTRAEADQFFGPIEQFCVSTDTDKVTAIERMTRTPYAANAAANRPLN
jgi:hypothetical protein